MAGGTEQGLPSRGVPGQPADSAANEQAVAFGAVLLDSIDNCRGKVVLLKF